MSPAGRPKGTATGRRPRVNITLEDEAQVAYLAKRGNGNMSAGVRELVAEAMQREKEGKK